MRDLWIGSMNVEGEDFGIINMKREMLTKDVYNHALSELFYNLSVQDSAFAPITTFVTDSWEKFDRVLHDNIAFDPKDVLFYLYAVPSKGHYFVYICDKNHNHIRGTAVKVRHCSNIERLELPDFSYGGDCDKCVYGVMGECHLQCTR